MSILVEKIYYPSQNGEDTIAALAYFPKNSPRPWYSCAMGCVNTRAAMTSSPGSWLPTAMRCVSTTI